MYSVTDGNTHLKVYVTSIIFEIHIKILNTFFKSRYQPDGLAVVLCLEQSHSPPHTLLSFDPKPKRIGT